ncbi:hypothetical protein GCM10020256_17280 [Streptomyces thermocoprophilus]
MPHLLTAGRKEARPGARGAGNAPRFLCARSDFFQRFAHKFCVTGMPAPSSKPRIPRLTRAYTHSTQARDRHADPSRNALAHNNG